ncbi:MAG: glycyl-radical enzyme activating protein [Desulfobacteraceae bacterium]|nr:MAG: glycyl-radical enzyme activating protein [Desulfobacteraceae bacterium]
MKGCPLSCWWCQNPEAIKAREELIYRESRCCLCGSCAGVCPMGAITLDQEQGWKIDRAKCDGCFDCVEVCPTRALEKVGDHMTVEEVVREIEKDEMFYAKSNGGVTLSGGEPLFQADFSYLILKACKKKGFHTALDTCGYGPWEVFEKLLEYVDLVLFDIKHMDPIRHEEATGKDNDLILSNLRKIPAGKSVWLRIPIIPGFNDTKDNLDAVGALGKEVGAEKISILPFHKLGEAKYQQLHQEYRAAGLNNSSKEEIKEIQNNLQRFGLQVAIGE